MFWKRWLRGLRGQASRPLADLLGRERRRSRARCNYRPELEVLEQRVNPSLISSVGDTLSYPNSTIVQIDSIWDMDNDGHISDGDNFLTGSGAMIGPNAVL